MTQRTAPVLVLVLTWIAMPASGLCDEPLDPSIAAKTTSVPDGFRLSVFASEPEIRQPIGCCMDDRARLWVAEAYSYPVHTDENAKDRIVILEDTDRDGEHDRRTVFFEGLNYVTGIEYGFGGVWVMTPPYLYFIPDRDRDDIPDGPPELLLDGFGTHANAHNLANGFAWGPDGWLYGTHGRTNWSMIGTPGCDEKDRLRFDGGVYRYHPTRHVWEPYADGTTNPWGIDWNDHGHAFITNCVNPHLFQVIQGAHYEPWRGRKSSQYAYQRIETIADHLHFTGLSNVRSGRGSNDEDLAGGGHAHCGTMIYLGDSLPENYRNTLFTNNIHGRRINNDVPVRHGSGYVASHAPDLLRSSDPWFMGVSLLYGPGGEIYVTDWSDTGECHSTRNTRRATGRVYQIRYGNRDLPRVDLNQLDNDSLAEMQLHRNDWFVRHARRILHERAANGVDLSNVRRRMLAILSDDPRVPRKLRAIWVLHVIGELGEQELLKLLEHEDENIRFWAVTLLCESNASAPRVRSRFGAIAREGDSALVRLALASGLQRMPLETRWMLARALAKRDEDNRDQNLPLMLWYAVEPLISDDLEKFVALGVESSIGRVRVNVARRVADAADSHRGLELLSSHLATSLSDRVTSDLLSGVLLGVEGERRLPMPVQWPSAFQRVLKSGNVELQSLAFRLAVVFDDSKALQRLREVANDRESPTEQRLLAISALVDRRTENFDSDLLSLLEEPSMRSVALRGLSSYQSPRIASAVLRLYPSFDPTNRQDAQLTLASRKAWTRQLLDAMESGNVDPKEMTAYCARQIVELNDDAITDRLAASWGGLKDVDNNKEKQIRGIKKWLTAEELERARLDNGRQLFVKHCQNCHRLFGEGGDIGPDITGAQRHNLDYMLENVVDPNAAVAKDYQMESVLLDDGRVITGLVVTEDERTLTLQTINQRIVLSRDEIESRKRSRQSIMPENLLDPLTDREIRDLFGYLRSR